MEKEFTEQNDQELSQKAKKRKSANLLNALLIGVMIGIVIYSISKNGFGFFILIPLFFIYKMMNNPKNK
jgi:F0F1-type ATP synthase assembly protein I